MELAKDTKFLLVTAVPRKGFRRCGFQFSRDTPALVSIEELEAVDSKARQPKGSSAKRILNETSTLVVKQLTAKPGAKEKATAKAEASKAAKARATKIRDAAIDSVADQNAERESRSKTPQRGGGRG